MENKQIPENLVFTKNYADSPTGSDIRELLEKNLRLSEEILEKTKYIKHYLKWQQVFGWIKILIIVVPIVWGLLYLPSLIQKYTGSYGSTLNNLTNPASFLAK